MKKAVIFILIGVLTGCVAIKDPVLKQSKNLTRHQKRLVMKFINATKEHNSDKIFKCLSAKYIEFQYYGTSMDKQQFIDELFGGYTSDNKFVNMSLNKITDIQVENIKKEYNRTIVVFRVKGKEQTIRVELDLYDDGFFGSVG